MSTNRVRTALIALGLTLSLATLAETPKPISVPAGDLVVALKAIAKQAGVELLFDENQLKGLHTKGVSGTLTSEEAIRELLQGTHLELSIDESTGAMMIGERRSVAPKTSGNIASTTDVAVARAGGERSSIGTGAEQQSAELTEIIVTAQKREERLQDVPVPVTAIGADSLVDSSQQRFQDYYTRIPGLSFAPGVRGEPLLAIRGVSADPYSNPTVGVTIDDVPYGSSTSQGGGYSAPDIDPSDLGRIEVLRGPQGTLYGASSLGGLLKFVTLEPSTDGVSGRLQGNLNSVHNGKEVGYGLRGAVNVPLTDTLAIRASGFTRRDPGYLDNVETGQRGINWGDAEGGLLSALWRPSQDFSLKINALLQRSELHGSSEVDLQSGLSDLQQNDTRGTGWYSRHSQFYSANLTGKLGGIELTALSGYTVDKHSGVDDFTAPLGGLAQRVFGVAGASSPDHADTTKFTEEIRLSTPVGQRFEWLLGAFYTHERSVHVQDVLAIDPATGATAASLLNFVAPTTYEEYAAFTDLTYHVTDRIQIQLGGRESQNSQSYSSSSVGLLTGSATPVAIPELHTKANSFTYLVTPSFKVSSGLMVYARLASGYRPGGPNVTVMPGIPATFAPDKTRNYDVGVKGDIADRALSFDASLYYIDWEGIQLLLSQSGISYLGNAGEAKSQGVELSVEAKPLTGLTIAAWVAWNDAELTKDFPAESQVAGVYGVSGDRLPYSSRFSGRLSLNQEFSLVRSVVGFAGGSVSYSGDREGVFTPSSQREIYPSYAQMDLRVGVRCGSWTANFFVNNVADRRGVLAGGLGTPNPKSFYYIQPRMIGLSLTQTF